MELIRLEDIHKTYHLGEVKVPALRGVSLTRHRMLRMSLPRTSCRHRRRPKERPRRRQRGETAAWNRSRTPSAASGPCLRKTTVAVAGRVFTRAIGPRDRGGCRWGA